jgi:DNA-directed RNA polymerase specialized sigma24 family protein
MHDMATTRQGGPGIARLLDRAVLTAYLLTGSLQHAEEAALAAIDSWKPDDEPEEVLFQNVLDAAARAQAQADPNDRDSSASYLPNELQAILRLAPQLRRCFVLRILVGLPGDVCGRMLDLHSDQVDEYTCAGLQSLGTVC